MARTRRKVRVVAEDDRPAHPRQPAYGLAQAVIERVRTGRVGLGLRQHGHEQLERIDPEVDPATG